MKKNFEALVIKVITFEAQDVLAAGSDEPSIDNTGSTGDVGANGFWSGCY